MGGSSSKKVTAANIEAQSSKFDKKGSVDTRPDDLMSMKSGVTHISSLSGDRVPRSRMKSTMGSLRRPTGVGSPAMGATTEEVFKAREKLMMMPHGHLRRTAAMKSAISGNLNFSKDFSEVGSNDECCRQDEIEVR